MTKVAQYILLTLLCVLSPLHVLSQIKGKVVDAETGEPVPYANVYYQKQKTIGTNTSLNGRYTLQSPPASDTIVFSFVGYKTHKLYVERGARKTINVTLEDLGKELDEVLVKPKKQRYRRKNNPAVELMEKVIAAKENHDLKQNEFYRYDKYQRITFGFNNITQEFVDSGFLRHYPTLVKQVEFCPQTQTRILPMTYNETASEHIFRKNPETSRDFIRGTHSEGITDLLRTGEIGTVMLQRFFTDVNIYDNSINLLERYFTSPLSSTTAISFYQYFIMDTVMIDNDSCIELSYVPQNPQDFGFSGRLWIINDGTYRVKRCLIHLPVRSSVNFISNLTIEQDFATLSNGQRILVKDNMIVEMGALKKFHNMFLKRTTSYTGFDFSPIPDEQFLEREQPREGTVVVEDDKFWQLHRTDSLTRSEATMPNMIRSIQNAKGYGWIMWIVRAFIENYVETAPPGKKNYVDFGPVNTIVSSNFIDKVRFRLSAQTTA
ncbi:MAG: carboxypeptidase-like regulatory domain-containing protein, partial [Paraprevotella sp.]|nr:carboxypeptidase-like regulatory domain-containing protein [Paraprevotella sp.]